MGRILLGLAAGIALIALLIHWGRKPIAPAIPRGPAADSVELSEETQKANSQELHELAPDPHVSTERSRPTEHKQNASYLENRREAGEGFSETQRKGVMMDPDHPLIYQGDLMVSEDHLKANNGQVSLEDVKYWTTGVVPYLLDERIAVQSKEALRELSEATRWKFIPRTNEKDYVYLRHSDLGGCQSYLGREGGEQTIELSETCSKGQVLHELLHTLGFLHEQSREDRDYYLTIIWEKIEANKRNQFVKLPAAVSQPVDVPFDFDSLLLYPSTAFSADKKSLTILRNDGQALIANRDKLSELDIKKADLLFELKVVDDQTGTVSRD